MEKFVVQKTSAKTLQVVVEAKDKVEAIYLAHNGQGEPLNEVVHPGTGIECLGTLAEFQHYEESASKAGKEMANLAPSMISQANRATLYV